MQKVEQRVDRRRAIRLGGFMAAGAAAATAGVVLPAASASAAPLSFNTIPTGPYRSVDTRVFGPSWKLPSGFFDDWDLWTDMNSQPRIPQSAGAVTFNVTVAETVNGGWLTLFPPNQFSPVSTINWMSSGVTLANGGTVQLAFSPQINLPGAVRVECGGAGAITHYIIDVTGYYI